MATSGRPSGAIICLAVLVLLALMAATSEAASCDCNYHKGGCTISKAAPGGYVCKCKYKGFWTCGGSAVRCYQLDKYFCNVPGKGIEDCRRGGGDCGGYKVSVTSKAASCDCDYSKGARKNGCRITKAAPSGYVCKCRYKGFWTCGGSTVKCHEWAKRYCRYPGKNIDDCRYGRGDCDGYTNMQRWHSSRG